MEKKREEKLGEAACLISKKICPNCGAEMHFVQERCLNGKKWWQCPECNSTASYVEEKTEKISDITCSLCGSKMKFEGRVHNHLMFSCSNENCNGAFLIKL